MISTEATIRQLFPELSKAKIDKLVPLCDEVESMENLPEDKQPLHFDRLKQIAVEVHKILGTERSLLLGITFDNRRKGTVGSA